MLGSWNKDMKEIKKRLSTPKEAQRKSMRSVIAESQFNDTHSLEWALYAIFGKSLAFE